MELCTYPGNYNRRVESHREILMNANVKNALQKKVQFCNSVDIILIKFKFQLVHVPAYLLSVN